jgi:hypothetical protein
VDQIKKNCNFLWDQANKKKRQAWIETKRKKFDMQGLLEVQQDNGQNDFGGQIPQKDGQDKEQEPQDNVMVQNSGQNNVQLKKGQTLIIVHPDMQNDMQPQAPQQTNGQKNLQSQSSQNNGSKPACMNWRDYV